MKTVLFATRTVPELAPLTGSSCMALLNVACKPLVVHTIEALAMAGLTDVIVVVSPHADALEAELGDGARWGMRFEYVLATAKETSARTIERISRRLGDEYLAVRGEILRTPIIGEFVKRARSTEARSIVATIGEIDAGLRLVKSTSNTQKKTLIGTADPGLHGEDHIRMEFPKANLSLLGSLREFHRAHLDLLYGRFAGLIIPGNDTSPNVRVGRHTGVSVQAIKQPPLLIGAGCRIADSAELGGEVVISDNVMIDRRARIRSSVIMPNTYIGELVEVTNAIVAGNHLIHVDTGTITTVADSFLLANIGPAEIGVPLRTIIDRLLGAGLLALSLCLWPLALLAALSAHPRQPLRSKRLVGNRKPGSVNNEFTAFEFATPVPLLRYLPYLLAVVAGHLRLVGVEPLEAGSSARTEDWELMRNEGQAGLFGPVQLTATHETPEEERTIVEAGYIGTRSVADDLKWMLKAVTAIASRRAWWPAGSLDASNPPAMTRVPSSASAQDLRGQIEFESFERVASATAESERNATP